MQDSKPQVSIIIPVKNGINGGIDKCLSGIFSQKSKYKYEVIAIDSGSSDGTLELIRSFKEVRLIQIPPEEFGHGKTRNLGAKSAQGDYLVFLNGDAWPANDNWLDPLIREIEIDEKMAGAYSRHLPKQNCSLYMVRDLEKTMPAHSIVKSRLNKFDYMVFSTVSAAIRQEIWARYPFSDNIPIYEDQDWGRRILKEGLKLVYVPSSGVYHSHNYGFREMFAQKYEYGKVLKKINANRMNPVMFLAVIIIGWMYKLFGDMLYILKKKVNISTKIGEGMIAVSARSASFLGRYLGEVHGK